MWQWIFLPARQDGMRWCWNRQTGTFEGRVRERVGSSPIHRTKLAVGNSLRVAHRFFVERLDRE